MSCRKSRGVRCRANILCGFMTLNPVRNPCCKVAINLAQRTNFAGAAGAEPRPNWCIGTSQQTEMYVFVGANQFLARKVGAALKTLRRTSGAANTWVPYWYCAEDYLRFQFQLHDDLLFKV